LNYWVPRLAYNFSIYNRQFLRIVSGTLPSLPLFRDGAIPKIEARKGFYFISDTTRPVIFTNLGNCPAACASTVAVTHGRQRRSYYRSPEKTRVSHDLRKNKPEKTFIYSDLFFNTLLAHHHSTYSILKCGLMVIYSIKGRIIIGWVER